MVVKTRSKTLTKFTNKRSLHPSDDLEESHLLADDEFDDLIHSESSQQLQQQQLLSSSTTTNRKNKQPTERKPRVARRKRACSKKSSKDQDEEASSSGDDDDRDDEMNLSFDEEDDFKTRNTVQPTKKPQTRSSTRLAHEQQQQHQPSSPIVISSNSDSERPSRMMHHKKRKIQSSFTIKPPTHDHERSKLELVVEILRELSQNAKCCYEKYQTGIVSYCQFLVNMNKLYQHMYREKTGISLIGFRNFLHKALSVEEVQDKPVKLPHGKALHTAVFNCAMHRLPSIAFAFIGTRTFSTEPFKALMKKGNAFKFYSYIESIYNSVELNEFKQRPEYCQLDSLRPNISDETMRKWKELILNPSPTNDEIELIENAQPIIHPIQEELVQEPQSQQQPSNQVVNSATQNEIVLSHDSVLESSTPPHSNIPFEATGELFIPQPQPLADDEISYNFDEDLGQSEAEKEEPQQRRVRISVITPHSLRLREKIYRKRAKHERRLTMYDVTTSENYHPVSHPRRKTHLANTRLRRRVSSQQIVTRPSTETVVAVRDEDTETIQASSSTLSVAQGTIISGTIQAIGEEIVRDLQKYPTVFPSPNLELIQMMSTLAQVYQTKPELCRNVLRLLESENGADLHHTSFLSQQVDEEQEF
ncbi:hypothetical protein C9374_012908 [Naegleria lovaniensis]|uniref:Uncharacterized protein n=1 Tax=Naegleria lovaniensis TaxID=51637 RepID=A0AA88GCE9_NAELO|nr:uncharacterized protein C9374_012908 [Naegleria lovaniensis]KAG2373062.1 hypothetical protein C9374_012908 [Naegleria lovaniensis]